MMNNNSKKTMIIFIYDPYIRKGRIFKNICNVEKTSNGFRIYKGDGFYKDFHRLCIWWEVKLTLNPNNPCVDCLFNYSTSCGCEDAKDFKFNLGNNRIVCAMYQSRNGATNKYGKENEK